MSSRLTTLNATPLTALAALLKGMASAHLSSQFDLLLTKLDQLQTDMVTQSPEPETLNPEPY